jgi:hypothetical protein
MLGLSIDLTWLAKPKTPRAAAPALSARTAADALRTYSATLRTGVLGGME